MDWFEKIRKIDTSDCCNNSAVIDGGFCNKEKGQKFGEKKCRSKPNIENTIRFKKEIGSRFWFFYDEQITKLNKNSWTDIGMDEVQLSSELWMAAIAYGSGDGGGERSTRSDGRRKGLWPEQRNFKAMGVNFVSLITIVVCVTRQIKNFDKIKLLMSHGIKWFIWIN